MGKLNPELARFGRWLLTFYALAGGFATAWISAEFDRERITALCLLGIPAFTFYTLFNRYMPNWSKKQIVLHKALIASILIGFAWGNVLLLNVVATDGLEQARVPTNIGMDAFDLAQKKGALGIYYETRW